MKNKDVSNMVKKFEEFINEIRFREVDDDGNDIKVDDRKENMPTPIEKYGKVFWSIDGYDGWMLRIVWRKSKQYKPVILIYNDEIYAGRTTFILFDDVGCNGYQTRCYLRSYEFNGGAARRSSYTQEMYKLMGEIRQDEESFGKTVDDMLKKLPDSAFKVEGHTYDIEHNGYQLGGKYKDYYVDFCFDGDDETLTIRKFDDVGEKKVIRKNWFSGKTMYVYNNDRYYLREPLPYKKSDFDDDETQEMMSQNFFNEVNNVLGDIPEQDIEYNY